LFPTLTFIYLSEGVLFRLWALCSEGLILPAQRNGFSKMKAQTILQDWMQSADIYKVFFTLFAE